MFIILNQTSADLLFTQVHTFSAGDAITVLSDYNAVVDLQDGHGGWNDNMKSVSIKMKQLCRGLDVKPTL